VVARVSELARDIAQVVAAEGEAVAAEFKAKPEAIAFHAPCTLQHALKVRGVVEGILVKAGCTLTPVPDGHLCCGSAGAYSLLQPELSAQLLKNKLHALNGGRPDRIATANIGCLAHLQSKSRTPVRHWIEILDQAPAPRPATPAVTADPPPWLAGLSKPRGAGAGPATPAPAGDDAGTRDAAGTR
jgi:glycolate oxidase iron-sulfur subunit